MNAPKSGTPPPARSVAGERSGEQPRMNLSGNIFITGGAGFLGYGIIARAKREKWDCRITILSRDDHKHAALLRDFPEVKCIRGDICGNPDYLQAAMIGHEAVIHAAANKHVDLSEYNAAETIHNNVYGSEQVAWAAIGAGVKRVIGISTDKACKPVNVYGMTKALMERIFIEANTWGETQFTLTRYGNVLASTGSMIGDWRAKLKQQGYINATDPNMTRFWLSVDQAVDLILVALNEPAGTITIPRLPALSMKKMEEYFLPEGTHVTYDGLRPGEKMDEELLTHAESHFADDFAGGGTFMSRYRLWPSTLKYTFSDLPFNYSSDKPDREMTKEELIAIVGLM